MAPWLKTAVGARVAGARFVCSLHGVTENLSGREIRSMRLAAGLTHATVLVAESLRPFAAGVIGVDPGKISVIPNGIDTDRFRPTDGSSQLRAGLGIPPEAFLVGTVARLSPVKNQALLIEAVAGMNDDKVHLVLAGDGECREDLEGQAQALGMRARVHFLGSVVETVPVYQALDLFVLSSVAEGMPMCILEAMACSVPIVSTDVGGIPELLGQGRLGWLVPSGNIEELTRVLQEAAAGPTPETRAAAQAGRDVCVEEFSTMAMARAYQKRYRG
jgi:glycosyltransferase involved in cell wall biosynthesis